MKSRLLPLPAPSGPPLLHISECTLSGGKQHTVREEKWQGLITVALFTPGRTFNLLLVLLWPVKVHGGCVSVQGVDGVGVRQQLWQERLKDVGQVLGEETAQLQTPCEKLTTGRLLFPPLQYHV